MRRPAETPSPLRLPRGSGARSPQSGQPSPRGRGDVLEQPLGGHVYFIGAGPGAPDLLTIRGREILGRADLVLFADSLVDPRICDFARPDAEIVGSSSLTLDEICERMISAARAGSVVARLQSGDPAIYGAIHEQMARLEAAGVPWTIVPGVSSAFAAAAALGVELTVPEVAQSVILARISGRASPVPPGQDLPSLAAHGTSLVLFLSVSHMARVVKDLLAGGYPAETPVAVAYRVSWPDEAVITGTLADIRAKVRAARWTRQALILVGPALAARGQDRHRSRLYASDYSHLFRSVRARRTRAQASAAPSPLQPSLPPRRSPRSAAPTNRTARGEGAPASPSP